MIFFTLSCISLICDIFHLAFVVDGEEVNGGADNLYVCNHPCAAGFSFSFGGDGQSYFVKVVAEFGAGGWILF